jgi:hypothetical protein
MTMPLVDRRLGRAAQISLRNLRKLDCAARPNITRRVWAWICWVSRHSASKTRVNTLMDALDPTYQYDRQSYTVST